MNDIYKGELLVTFYQQLAVPRDCKPLCIQVQNGVPCVWYELSKPYALTHRLTIWLVGTGTNDLDNVPDHASYLGTIQLKDGALVLHCYWDQRKV